MRTWARILAQSAMLMLLLGVAKCWHMQIDEAMLDDVPALDLKFGNYTALSFFPNERQFEFNIGPSEVKLEVAFGPLSQELQDSHPFLTYLRPHGYTPSTISEDDPRIIFPKWSGTISQESGGKVLTRFTNFLEANGSAPITNETDGDWVIGARITDISVDTLGFRIGGVKSNDEPTTDPPQVQGDLFPVIFVAPLYIFILVLEAVIGFLVYCFFTRHKKNHAALGELQDKMIKQGIMAAIGVIIMVVALVFPTISIVLSFRHPTYTCCHYFPRPGSSVPIALDDARCFEGDQSDICFFNQSQAQSVILFVWYIWPWGAIIGLLSWLIGMGLVVFSALQFSRLLKSQHQGTPAVSFTVTHEF